MDRNNNWQLTKKFYDSLVGNNSSNRFESAEAALKEHYSAGKNDENLPSSVIDQSEEQFIKDGDGVIIFNFRADRARQMTRAIGDPNLEEFERANFPNNLELATMTPYEEDWDMEIGVVFDPPEVEHNLAKLISDSGINQVHLAESEKKAHATYFFNGGQEVKYNQELDQIIPSPSVDSFDQKPQMSLEILTQATLDYLKENPYFVLLNVANPDMVGHSGNFEATRIAIEAVDKYLGQILLAASKFNYLSFVTADHGNCEQMINLTTGKADKEHTVNPVPFFWVDNFTKTNKNYEKDKLWQPISTRSPSGVLADVSATVLANLEISPAANMVGEDLRNSLVKL
jgi:2,3-bisphosphoglycerate-independent phosphoglycerate mutase